MFIDLKELSFLPKFKSGAEVVFSNEGGPAIGADCIFGCLIPLLLQARR
jgi:hypothetical protein